MDTTPSSGDRTIRVIRGSEHERGSGPPRPRGEVVDLGNPPGAPAFVDLTGAAAGSDADVITLPTPASEDGCGPDGWCPVCREEIRQEALAWIRDLNATATTRPAPVPVVRRITGDLWSRPT